MLVVGCIPKTLLRKNGIRKETLLAFMLEEGSGLGPANIEFNEIIINNIRM
jgi:hypothetical protein